MAVASLHVEHIWRWEIEIHVPQFVFCNGDVNRDCLQSSCVQLKILAISALTKLVCVKNVKKKENKEGEKNNKQEKKRKEKKE